MAFLTRLLWAALVSMLVCGAEASLEYQVKAAFLYNFARFAEWPPETMSRTSSIGICVLGRDPFGAVLEQTFRGKTVNGRPFNLRRIAEATGFTDCHVLFYASPDGSALSVLRHARQAGILTVGETPGFIEMGGMIEFVLADNKVRFKINPDNTQRGHIRLSAQLLQLAWVVHDAKGRAQ